MAVHGDDAGKNKVVCSEDALDCMREELRRLRKQELPAEDIATLLQTYKDASVCPSCTKQHAPDCKLVAALLNWEEATGQRKVQVSLADDLEDLGISKYEGDE